MESKSGIFIQFIMPYLAVTIEAFVFCFAGEYLSTKVSILLLPYRMRPGVTQLHLFRIIYSLSFFFRVGPSAMRRMRQFGMIYLPANVEFYYS